MGASKITRLLSEALMTDHGGRERTSRWGMTKEEVVANAGMVSAGHRLAAEAGVEMLRRGGNAIDAAVAAAWAVGVVEPWMSGAGGVGAMVVHHSGRQVIGRVADLVLLVLHYRPPSSPGLTASRRQQPPDYRRLLGSYRATGVAIASQERPNRDKPLNL